MITLNRITRLTLLATAQLSIGTTVLALGAAIHVNKTGSLNPDGTSGRPFQTLASAAGHLPCAPGSDIILNAGTYYETVSISAPCILKANGPVSIGDMDYAASTTLTLVTLNTHLFGNDPGPSWQDWPRAVDLADQLRDSGADIIALQEIWDEDLFWGGDNQGAGIRANAQYAHGFHGSATCNGGCLLPTLANSGLAVMSRFPALIDSQDCYGEREPVFGLFVALCDGCLPTDCSPECLASKSYVEYWFIKEGFQFALFTTHTQSGTDGDQVGVRKAQIMQLMAQIQRRRLESPSTSIFVTGDFNVVGGSAEYNNPLGLGPLMAAIGGRDGDPNAPGFACDGERIHTLDGDNELAQYFEDGFIFWCGVQVPTQRLDYVFYFPPADGSIEILPEQVDVIPYRAPEHCEDGLCSDELSDHYGLFTRFKLIRIQ